MSLDDKGRERKQSPRSGRPLLAGAGFVVGAIIGAILGLVGWLAAAVARVAVSRKKIEVVEPAAARAVWRPDWNSPRPSRLVHPTYWPMVLALAIAFLLWGLVSSLLISAIGLVLFGLALWGWIGELRQDG